MSGPLHVRVDNRLLHGQVVQFWIPHLGIDRLIVADDDVAKNEAMPMIYRLAVPESVELTVIPVVQLAAELETVNLDNSTVLTLLRDVYDVTRAQMSGTIFKRLTLGNVHASPDRTRVTDSVYLSEEELAALERLKRGGVAVEIQTFPGEVLRLAANPEGGVSWSRP
jgi:mannose/fructose/N-acetylgalactosamine-specific phosphotransferase system component IIB